MSSPQYRDWLVTSFTKNEDDIKTLLVSIGVRLYAYINHNNDTYTQDDIDRLSGVDGKGNTIVEGQKKDSHFHIYFHTNNKYTISAMCKIWGEPSSCVDKVAFRNKVLRYLVHTSEYAPKKPYPVENVKTNIKEFESIVKNDLAVSCSTSSNIDYCEILDIIRKGVFYSYSQLLDYLSIFKSDLVGLAIDKAYALKIYISETQPDNEKEKLYSIINDLKEKNVKLYNRLCEYEDLPKLKPM